MNSLQLYSIVSFHLHLILPYNYVITANINPNIIPKNYEKVLSPMTKAVRSTGETTNLTVVTIGTKNHLITDISEKNMRIDIDLTIYLYWWDPRLINTTSLSSKTLRQSLADDLWKPQIKLKNCIGCRGSLIQTSKFGVTSSEFIVTGKEIVFVSIRKKITLACKFDLSNYPFNQFSCGIEFETFLADQVGTPIKLNTDSTYQTPNSIDRIIIQSDFRVVSRTHRECLGSNLTYLITNDCLEELIVIRRLITGHVLSIFIPSIFLVIISWICFWLPLEMPTAKLIICFVPIIPLVMLYNIIKFYSPEMSSFKAIDVWMITCISFVFASVVQFGIVCCLYQRQTEKQQISPYIHSVDKRNPRSKYNKIKMSASNQAVGKKAAIIDKVARIVFPLLFIIFNLVFWPYCLTKDV